ncbi:MAG TPA: phosphatase PAP2 family protein [Micropepsaceae bacterium]|jgi:undecaprenyl-diphosphatase
MTPARTRELNFLALAAIAALLFVFGVLAENVIQAQPFAFDNAILLALRVPGNRAIPIGPAWLPETARDITSLGSIPVIGLLLLAVTGYLLLERKRGSARWILAAAIGGVLLDDLLKFAISRPRPDMIDASVRVFSTSFPSGHASLSAIAYLTLGALLAQTHDSIPIRVYILALAAALTILVGLSRLYLGVHYPSDVLAGWCIGGAWALACWSAMRWLQHPSPVDSPARP